MLSGLAKTSGCQYNQETEWLREPGARLFRAHDLFPFQLIFFADSVTTTDVFWEAWLSQRQWYLVEYYFQIFFENMMAYNFAAEISRKFSAFNAKCR